MISKFVGSGIIYVNFCSVLSDKTFLHLITKMSINVLSLLCVQWSRTFVILTFKFEPAYSVGTNIPMLLQNH
jgi:hypothetical protein